MSPILVFVPFNANKARRADCAVVQIGCLGHFYCSRTMAKVRHGLEIAGENSTKRHPQYVRRYARMHLEYDDQQRAVVDASM